MGWFGKKDAPKDDKPIVRSYAHHMADKMNDASKRNRNRNPDTLTREEQSILDEAAANGVTLERGKGISFWFGWAPEDVSGGDYEKMDPNGQFMDPFSGEWLKP